MNRSMTDEHPGPEPAASAPSAGAPERAPASPPPPPEEEMGGEAPCQLHRVWDVEE